MAENTTIMWCAFAMASSLVLLVFMVATGRKNRLNTRLQELSTRGTPGPDVDTVAKLARSTLPKMGAPLLPKTEGERTKLQARLTQAGLYSRQAMVVFLGVKMVLMVGPALIGIALGVVGLIPIMWGLVFGAIFGISGMIGPSFWLDRRKKARQASFRRALPDALDVLVICLEGGLSLPGAVRRVTGELRTAHPVLAGELSIVLREVQLGLSTGEALRQFGERSDLEEVRGLASVITQSERFGASLVKALRVHADTLREKRLQYAEEMAQKAATKILFPTVFFIMPAIFIVILGPAVIQITAVMDKIIQH
jgi:tight adherence protein C